MLGLLRQFSVHAGEGRSLQLHGCRSGSMLGVGCGDVAWFIHTFIAFFVPQLGWPSKFFMTPWQVFSASIRSLCVEMRVIAPIKDSSAVRLCPVECT